MSIKRLFIVILSGNSGLQGLISLILPKVYCRGTAYWGQYRKQRTRHHLESVKREKLDPQSTSTRCRTMSAPDTYRAYCFSLRIILLSFSRLRVNVGFSC